MSFSEIAEIIVCVLAVWGVYCIFSSFVAWCLPRQNVSLGVHAKREQSELELYNSLREAQLLAENSSELSRRPVVLVDFTMTENELKKIVDTGCAVYLQYDTKERGRSEDYREGAD